MSSSVADYAIECTSTSFLLAAKQYSKVWVYPILFIHSLVDGHWIVSILSSFIYKKKIAIFVYLIELSCVFFSF